MTRLAFDIYPPPVTGLGSRLVRLTNQHYAGGTTYIHGRPMGQGTIVVEKGNSWVTATNFAVGNYVIVRDLDISEVSDSLNVLGGFFLEEGDFLLVSDDPKVLTFSGRSTIVILERAILGPEALSGFAGPNDIIDGYWRWGSDTYGGVMRRAIYEANLQTPAGLPMFDTDLTGSDSVKWDDAEDSNGVAWPAFAGEYRTQCGTTLLELYRELYGFGVELEIDARTFDIYAYNPDGYGTDRTSATFATGKVRFVAGVNIAADLSRQIRGKLRRTHLLVRTTDWPQGGWIESDDYSPGDPVYKGVYQTGDISGDPSTSTVIDSRAQRNMDLRTLSEDAVRIPLHEPGDDEANGRYTPGPNYTPGPTATTGHFWTGDLITLDTGDHTMDYADASKRVEAVEYVLREAGDWQAIVHLGPRTWIGMSPLDSLAGATAHTLPLELCQPSTISTFTPVEALGAVCTLDPVNYASLSGFGTQVERVQLTLDRSAVVGQSIVVLTTHRGSSAESYALVDSEGNTYTEAAYHTDGSANANLRVWYTNVSAPLAAGDVLTYEVANAGTGSLEKGGKCISAYLFDGALSGPAESGTGSGFSGSPAVTVASADLIVAAIAWKGGATSFPDTFTADPDWGAFDGAATNANAADSQQITGGFRLNDGEAYNGTIDQSRDWVTVGATFSTAASSGAVNDGHADLVGTSIRAPRCDHRHDVHRGRAPTVTDDWATAGYKLGTIWAQLDSLESPTEIVGVWMLVDDTEGAAVWSPISVSDGSDHTHPGAAGLPWFVVTDYGAVGDGTTDDTSAINAAIAALNTAGRGVLYFPAGEYLISSALTPITATATIRGDGGTRWNGFSGASIIRCSSATAVAMEINSLWARVEHLSFDNSATPSAGAAIEVSSADALQRVDFHDVTIDSFYDGVDVQTGTAWVMDGCMFRSQVRYSVRVRNTVSGDFGDWVIANSGFWGSDGATAAIRIESSGGGRILGNKVNQNGGTRYVNGIDVAFSGSTQTVILIVANNSIENVSSHGISVTTATGSSFYRHLIFNANQFGLYTNNSGKAISLVSTDSGDLSDISIANNIFHTNGTARSAIQLTNCDSVTLVGNVLDGFNALYTNTTSTNVTEIGGSASALDDLSDVTITSVASDDQLQYVGGAWVNNGRRWEPVVTDPGTGPELVFDGSGDIVMTFVEYS